MKKICLFALAFLLIGLFSNELFARRIEIKKCRSCGSVSDSSSNYDEVYEEHENMGMFGLGTDGISTLICKGRGDQPGVFSNKPIGLKMIDTEAGAAELIKMAEDGIKGSNMKGSYKDHKTTPTYGKLERIVSWTAKSTDECTITVEINIGD